MVYTLATLILILVALCICFGFLFCTIVILCHG